MKSGGHVGRPATICEAMPPERPSVWSSAIVQQLSGEDWNGVTLTLSTAATNMATPMSASARYKCSI